MNSETIDLVVLIPDADYEATLDALLSSRTQAFGILPITFKQVRAIGRDPDVRLRAEAYLRVYIHQAKYALVLFDKEGSGGEGISVEELELEVKQGLERNGWDRRCEVIALDPELEIWVWSNSPRVPESLGLDSHQLNEVLERFPRNAIGKPVHPKEAMQACLGLARKPRSAAIFRQLASSVSLRGCQDRAFRKLLSTLQTWFPPHGS